MTVHVPPPAGARDQAASSEHASSGAGRVAVAAIKRLIAQREKQLQREEQQLRIAGAQNRPGDAAGLAHVTSAQAAIATTQGQRESAMQKLVQAPGEQGAAGAGRLLEAQPEQRFCTMAPRLGPVVAGIHVRSHHCRRFCV